MNKDFFKKTKILDGGMGQELIARGVGPNGTLWSANALLQDKYHDLLFNTHVDFVKAGAEVIVTATFCTRKKRLMDNKIEEKLITSKFGNIRLVNYKLRIGHTMGASTAIETALAVKEETGIFLSLGAGMGNVFSAVVVEIL